MKLSLSRQRAKVHTCMHACILTRVGVVACRYVERSERQRQRERVKWGRGLRAGKSPPPAQRGGGGGGGDGF